MIIKLSNDLKNQEIWANGKELAQIMGRDRKKGKRVFSYPPSKKEFVHSFRNPILMTDNYKISKLKPELRDTLFSLYNSRPRIVEYDGVQVEWGAEHSTVWCPSIDTVIFARALKKIKKNLKNVSSAIEIGCGSGFLSKYLLKKHKNIKEMIINDLNPDSIDCAKKNIADERAKFHVGDGVELLKNKKFDLVICNPPYVPRPDSVNDNAYESVDLLRHFLQEGQKYLNEGGILLTNYSNLSEDFVFDEKTLHKAKKLDSMEVPLKVNNIMNNKKWLDFLKNNGLKEKYKKGYNYWQKINVVMIEDGKR